MRGVIAVQSREIKERNEKVKQWLWQYRDAKKEVRRLEEELQELIELQESCGAIQYSDMPKGGGSQSDLSDGISMKEELWCKISEAKRKRDVELKKIESIIDRLENANEREVMTYRYIRSMSWEQICVKIDKKWTQVHRYHAKALEQIKKYINF